jgi:hypothetical protein
MQHRDTGGYQELSLVGGTATKAGLGAVAASRDPIISGLGEGEEG